MREIWSPRPPISISPQSPATRAWAWASLGGGGKKKIGCPKLVVQFQEQFSFFGAPPPGEAQAQAPLAGD